MTKEMLIIGDIHGEYHQVKRLIEKMIKKTESSSMEYLFLGDLIDTKYSDEFINQLAVLQLVKSLCDENKALCVMGNHEFNAIGWATLGHNAQPLRDHSKKNTQQHIKFLNAVKENSEAHRYWINWFKTLPLFIQNEHLNAIHACWFQRDKPTFVGH